jgi:hypothetical protein
MAELANDPKEIELYPGSAHGTDLFATSQATAVSERILSFIQAYAPIGATTSDFLYTLQATA